VSTCATPSRGKMLKEPSNAGGGMGAGVGVFVGGGGVLVGGSGVLVGGGDVSVGVNGGVFVAVAGPIVHVAVGCGEIWANTIADAVNNAVISAAAKTSPMMMWIVSFVFI
jgi:hypothetical protein